MILVVGGTGALGSCTVGKLVAAGHHVRVLNRGITPRTQTPWDESIEYVTGDVRVPESLTVAFDSVDLVVSAMHGFAGTGGNSPATVDRDGNLNLIAAAERAGAEVLLLSVVRAAEDSPMELFRMKWVAEQRLRASGAPWTIVRATAFAETWIGLLEQTAGRSGRPLVFGRGDNPINFVSIDDVANVVVRAATDQTQRGKTLILGGPRNLTMNELAAAVQVRNGWAGSPKHVPRAMLRAMRGMGAVAPKIGRQAAAALAMDTIDLGFDPAVDGTAYADLPPTDIFRQTRSAREA